RMEFGKWIEADKSLSKSRAATVTLSSGLRPAKAQKYEHAEPPDESEISHPSGRSPGLRDWFCAGRHSASAGQRKAGPAQGAEGLRRRYKAGIRQRQKTKPAAVPI